MNKIEILKGLQKRLDELKIKNKECRAFIEDEFESRMYLTVSILKNDRFEVKYTKSINEVELLTTYSNIKIDDNFVRELNLLRTEINVSNIKLNDETSDKTVENVKKAVKLLVEGNNTEEHFDNEINEAKIKESKKVPNYKKIFANGLRTKKIYYTETNKGFELQNIIYTSKLEMIDTFILLHNSSNSNFVFINKEKDIIERDFYINAGNYEFKKIGK